MFYFLLEEKGRFVDPDKLTYPTGLADTRNNETLIELEVHDGKNDAEIDKRNEKKIKDTGSKDRYDYFNQLKVAAETTLNKSLENKAMAIIGEELIPRNAGDCGGKHCITKDNYDKYPNVSEDNIGKLIREINIRLAGFGGNVPTTEFTTKTEATIKQFQRDYMKVPETGKICGGLLVAVDEFSKKYDLSADIWKKRVNKNTDNEMLCPCGKCDGFGKGRNKGEYYRTTKIEAYHRYEYHGVHKSLLWGLKGVIFYLEKTNLGYTFKLIESGYRCWDRNLQKGRKSSNHKGKALDLHFKNKEGNTINSTKEVEDIRSKIFNKYLGAKWDWKKGQNDIFNLESTDMGATSWVHFDVREYHQDYLKDQFFCKDSASLNGQNIIQLAKDLGLDSLTNCRGSNSMENLDSKCFCKSKNLVKSDCQGKGCSILDENYEKKAKLLGIEKEILQAIGVKESKSDSFYSKGQATILFERHYMYRLLKKNGKSDEDLSDLNTKHPSIVNSSQGGYGKYSEQYIKLSTAKKIDYDCAVQSCSWGKFQVMGSHYELLYSTPLEMEQAMNKCELQQFEYFIAYLEKTSGLIKALKDKNWQKIASLYNGSSWRTINPTYDTDLEYIYNDLINKKDE